MSPVIATIAGVAFVAVASMAVGGWRAPRSTSDFYVAARSVTPRSNAAAIGSEYISAAAFLGLAGLVLAYGVDMLWYPIGAAAGYVVLLALVTAPMRRSGSYTLSDFAEWRLRSIAIRRIVTFFVVFIGLVYLLPQIHGAGLTLRLLVGAPLWVGWLLVCLVVVAVGISGGMRSITGVQALQFWLKLAALGLTALVLCCAWRAADSPVPRDGGLPVFASDTRVTLDATTVVAFSAETTATIDGNDVRLTPGRHRFAAGTTLVFPAGARVPHAEGQTPLTGDRWSRPYGGASDHPLYATLSVLVAAALGTMGLPHVVVRFYTNPDGKAARRTVVMVLGLLGLFYLFPPIFGVLGRVYVPDVLMTGNTDEAVLLLPGRMVPGLGGALLTGLLAAGAFAAFLGTSSGIAVAVGGAIATCVMRGGVGSFRLGVCAVVGTALALTALVDPQSSPRLVLLAFSVAAATLCPLLVLGIWWRGLTPAGAGAGLIVGGGLTVAAVVVGISGVAGSSDGGLMGGWVGAVITQPALCTVPVTFSVMVSVSLLTTRRVPAGVGRMMARLHLPEEAGQSRLTSAFDRSSR